MTQELRSETTLKFPFLLTAVSLLGIFVVPRFTLADLFEETRRRETRKHSADEKHRERPPGSNDGRARSPHELHGM